MIASRIRKYRLILQLSPVTTVSLAPVDSITMISTNLLNSLLMANTVVVAI